MRNTRYHLHRTPTPIAALSFAFIAIWLLLAVFPFLWTVWGSLKIGGDFFSYTG